MRIEKPCHENFSAMPASETGRYCNSCNHIVIDFTQMTTAEITNYFHNQTGKTCGRFMNAQLEGARPESRDLIERRNQLLKKVHFKPVRLFVLAYFMIIMLLSGCRKRTAGTPIIVGYLHPRYTHTTAQDPDKPTPKADSTKQN